MGQYKRAGSNPEATLMEDSEDIVSEKNCDEF
jgi:hypothetical protein